MIIDCVSDLHGYRPMLDGGDILLIAGDFTRSDTEEEIFDFFDWVHDQKYRKKVLVAGNHDVQFQKQKYEGPVGVVAAAFDYLCDSGTEFEGLKIWGSPWTRWFEGINPACTGFTRKTEESLGKKFALIPSDTDILVTHSPPWTVLDKIVDGRQMGSTALMAEHMTRLRPRLWVFGHIHEAYGQDGPYEWNDTRYVNAAYVNEHYKPVNKPIRVIL